MKKPIFFLFFIMLGVASTSQAQNLNEYKYVIVPVKYDFLNEKDQYQLNSMTEFLFEKYGFTILSEDEKFPDDLANNPCAALNAEVISLSGGMFTFVTKIKVLLKDCHNQVVFESKEGRSRLKKYKFSYQEALRDAFSSVEALDYSYSEPSKNLAAKDSEETIPMEKPNLENRNEPLRFLKNGVEFELKKQEKAFVLQKVGNKNPAAFLNETSTGNFIYRSEKINGSAYFDDAGNLVVEYFDAKTGKMEKMVYGNKEKG